MEDILGNKSNIGNLLITITDNHPSGPNPIFIYGVDNQIVDYDNGVQNIIFTSSLTVNINALATNRDDNLIYWANGTTIYAWDYIKNVEFIVKIF